MEVAPIKIRLKMIVAFLAIALLGVIGGYLSIASNKDIRDEVSHRTASVEEVQGINQIKIALHANQAAIQVLMGHRHWAEIGETTEKHIAEQESKAAEAQVISSFEDLEKYLRSTKQSTEDGLEIALESGERDEAKKEQQQLLILDKLNTEIEIYKTYALQFLNLSERNLNEAEELLESKLEPHYNDKILPLVEEYATHAEDTLALEVHKVQKTIAKADALTMGLTIIAVAVAAGLGLVVSQLISKPITGLRDAANEIANGNLTCEIKVDSRDEIGDLAVCFNAMRESVLKTNQNLNKLVLDRTKDLERANEELRQKDQLKDEFISIASHELKNPIQPILGFAELAKQGKINQQQAWDGILEHARRLQRLAYDIIDVSKIESGDLQYVMEEFPINDTIVKVISDARLGLSTDVSIVPNLDENVQIEADRDRITQVLTNIIGNAVKFTKKGTIKVESRLFPEANKIEIKVNDNGSGISNDMLPKIFNKFATKASGDYHGAGLGLFISKAIVEAHGGEISAYNNKEGGATIQIVLPVNRSAISQDSLQPSVTLKPSAKPSTR